MIKMILQKLFQGYCWLLLHTYLRVKVHGKEQLPSENYLIISNHNSHLDYVILSIFSGKGFRNMYALAARDYWYENPFRDRFINLFLNAIPIARKNLYQTDLLQSVIERCRNVITSNQKNKASLVIFPEGKRSTTGEIQPFKQGASIIARDLNLEVVPTYIHGSHDAWPKGRLLMTPKVIHVYFGKAIKFDESSSQSAVHSKQANKQWTRMLEDKVKEMRDLHEKGNYLTNVVSKPV